MCRNHPLAIRYAHENRGGYGLPHFVSEQRITKIKQIIKHIQMETSLGKLLLIHLSWTQLTAGVSFKIMEETQQNLSFVGKNIWIAVQEMLKDMNGRIKMEYNYANAPLRTSDVAINEAFLNTQIPQKTIKSIQACRIYLQITYLSEICTIDGKQILQEALDGDKTKLKTRATTKRKWP